ncbi:MAG: type II toxin-antitoxin system prevent-host-death family antitoxin [Bacteroidota bacterium]
MDVVTISNLRQNIRSYFERVVNSRNPLLVTRQNGEEELVIMSKSDYEQLSETHHLLKSPKNAERLMRAIDNYNQGNTTQQDLIE